MSVVVTFKDRLWINDLYENINTLKDAIQKYNEIKIDLSNVKEIDTASMQMLIATKKECKGCGKRIDFVISEEVNNILVSTGIQL